MENSQKDCPFCGATIKVSAKSCPHCGSDSQTGWSDGTYLDGIDMPEDFDYGDTLEKEFGAAEPDPPKKKTLSWQAITGLVILVLFVWLLLQRLV